MPDVRVLAAYRIKPSESLIQQAIQKRYEGMRMSRRARKRAEAEVRKELASVVLLDIIVHNADHRFDIMDFGQPGSDQVAYDEVYLTPDGERELSRFDPPKTGVFRLVFFLHEFHPGEPLTTSYGEVAIPSVQEMPKHLERRFPYEPLI